MPSSGRERPLKARKGAPPCPRLLWPWRFLQPWRSGVPRNRKTTCSDSVSRRVLLRAPRASSGERLPSSRSSVPLRAPPPLWACALETKPRSLRHPHRRPPSPPINRPPSSCPTNLPPKRRIRRWRTLHQPRPLRPHLTPLSKARVARRVEPENVGRGGAAGLRLPKRLSLLSKRVGQMSIRAVRLVDRHPVRPSRPLLKRSIRPSKRMNRPQGRSRPTMLPSLHRWFLHPPRRRATLVRPNRAQLNRIHPSHVHLNWAGPGSLRTPLKSVRGKKKNSDF